MEIPAQMRALVHDRWAPSGRSFKEWPLPSAPGKGQVLVKVCSAGVNPVDYMIPFVITNGRVVGLDFSGIIVSVGEGVDQSTLSPGTAVFGCLWFGAMADYILVDHQAVCPKPQRLSHNEAAALPVAYMTALQALRHHGNLPQGGSVLVVGASGGCDLAIIQLARAMGASEIVGVCSGANAELVKSHGCTAVVDYKTETILGRYQRGHFDLCIDASPKGGGDDDYTSSLEEATKPGGRHIDLTGGLKAVLHSLRLLMSCRSGRYINFFAQISSSDFEAIVKLLEVHQARPILESSHTFDAAGVEAAYAKQTSRRVKGKIVIELNAV